MSIIVTDRNGKTIEAGDPVVSFRGETATFVRVSNTKQVGKSAKVVVRWDGTDEDSIPYYETVFDLDVQELVG